MRWRNGALAAVIGIGMILVGTRIWYVNKDIKTTPVERYKKGEEVFIENNIFWDDTENMKDYSITMKDTELLSYEEFLKKYDYIENKENPLFENGKDAPEFPEMVFDLELEVKNMGTEDREDTGINLLKFQLIMDDYVFQQSQELYEVANPDIPDGTRSFRLQPGTSKIIHLPCYFQTSGKIEKIPVKDVEEADVRLLVSLYPVQKEIYIK